jgi:hypothetical protein
LSVGKYFHSKPSRPTDERYQEALRKVDKIFHLPNKVNPLHINDSIKYYKNVDRSPGLPYTQYGLKRKDEVDPESIKLFVHKLKYNIYPKCYTPCTAAVKTVVSRTRKFRTVWAYPAHMTFAEGMFAQPLIWSYEAAEGPYALWVKFSKGHMKRLMVKRNRHRKWLGVDWSSFDSTIPAWLIRDAFVILRSNLDFSKYREWGSPTDPDTLPRLWKQIVSYFINTPIRFQDGLVWKKRQGIPSGSYFTNLLGSVVNAIVMNYLVDADGSQFYMGDDSLIELRDANLSDLALNAEQIFGMTLNVEKSEFGTYVSFLGYKMGVDGTPLAQYEKLVAQLLVPSNPDRSVLDFVSRARALQLSCFGRGCWSFTYQVQVILDDLGLDITPSLWARDEVMVKLEALDLANWPPLNSVIQRT